jgi:hypothetical protein
MLNMKKLNRLKCLLFAISSCFQINGCATAPPDVFVFERLSERLYVDPVTKDEMYAPSPTCMAQIAETSCGHGVSVISGKEIFIGNGPTHLFDKKTWDQIQMESILLPAVESYAPLATYMINACKKMNCSSQVDQFKIKLDSLNGVQGALITP